VGALLLLGSMQESFGRADDELCAMAVSLTSVFCSTQSTRTDAVAPATGLERRALGRKGGPLRGAAHSVALPGSSW
jgi:hypothetical protein